MTEPKKNTRYVITIPVELVKELRKIRDEHHTSIPGAIALLINFYKDNQKCTK